METFVDLVNKFGVSTAILAAIALGTWRVIKWLQPRAEKVIDAHIDLVSSLKKNHEETLTQVAETTKQTSVAVVKLCERLDSVRCPAMTGGAATDCTAPGRQPLKVENVNGR
jgi:hypothetical protein